MADNISIGGCSCSRRDFLRRGLYGIGISAGLPAILQNTSVALAAESLLSDGESHPNRILVVVELSGGNDGLNTIVPYGDDEYYRMRPRIGIPQADLLKIDDAFGFHPSLEGFERLYKDGDLAVVHGCGYDNPTLSHFAAMGFWHTAVPHGGEKLGWVGRLADEHYPHAKRNLIVNIGNSQSPAVRSGAHTPLVFNNPTSFRRQGIEEQEAVFKHLSQAKRSENESLEFLTKVAENAAESSKLVRDIFAAYRSTVDYGAGVGLGNDLRKVAALIEAKMPTRLYYVSYQGNAFDTHVHQADLHTRLLMYTADGVRGFMQDLERIGRAEDVAVMMFTEFGRRVEENASLGTDHGTATPMFVFGKGVTGGLYGEHPSLTKLDDGNLIKTTDFREVYATLIEEWLGYKHSEAILKGDFPTLGLFA